MVDWIDPAVRARDFYTLLAYTALHRVFHRARLIVIYVHCRKT
jgi:hypothetical protein